MKPDSTSSIYRIGTLDVRIPHVPHDELRGLVRDPVASGEKEATLLLEMVDEPDWGPSLDRGGDVFTKALPSHVCRIDFVQREIQIRMVAEQNGTGWYFIFRDIFASLCALSGDVFLHASAVEFQGMASAFCAYSGGGKSTIAGLLGGQSSTINDEVNWVFPGDDGKMRMLDQRYYRNPPKAAHASLPLHRIHVIRKAPTCALLDLPATETFPILLAAPFGNDPMLPARTQAAARLLSLGYVGGLEFNLRADDVRRCLAEAQSD